MPPPERYGPEWSGTKRHSLLTRLRVPGCYAYQVDGRTFSYVVIFEARLEPPAGPEALAPNQRMSGSAGKRTPKRSTSSGTLAGSISSP